MMSRKLTTAEACFELCQGAHICVSHHVHFKRPFISCSNPTKYKFGSIGYITSKQFEEISASNSIKCIGEKEDKYGNYYKYYVAEDYVLASAREEYLKRKREKKNEQQN